MVKNWSVVRMDTVKDNIKMNEKTINPSGNKPNTGKHKCICTHCGQPITQVKLIGISLICPSCKKPQDSITKECKQIYDDKIIICKHCKKPIEKVKLEGFSLICPLCKKPRNGEPHIKR